MSEVAKPKDYRKSLRARVAARYSVLVAALVMAIVFLIASFLPYSPEGIGPVWTSVWFITFAVFVLAGLYLHNAKCPRCSNRFAVHAYEHRYNSFSLRCMNCGLSADDISEF